MNQVDLTTKHTQRADELSLLDHVVLILEQAHANVVRAVNSNMVTAYWLIGWEAETDVIREVSVPIISYQPNG